MNLPTGYNFEPRVAADDGEQKNDVAEIAIDVNENRLDNLDWCSCGHC
jgi:hypothetical protein